MGQIIDSDNKGNPSRAAFTCTDITRIKDSESNQTTLDENETGKILDFFVKQLPADIAIFDTEMRHKFVSNVWKENNILGEHREFIGKSYDKIYPNEAKVWLEFRQKALKGEIVQWYEEIDKSHNKTYWCDGICAPWYAMDGSLGGFFMCLYDVTNRVKNKQQLTKAYEKLELSNQALDRFAYVCSHDLKEPLRATSNFIHLLFTRNAAQFDEESMLYVNYVLKSIDRMSTLIKDILLYSEITEQTKEHLDMNAIIHDIKETFNYRLLEIGGNLDVQNLPEILGIKTQINQLFTNLISNAIKFHSKNPLIIEIFAADKNSFWEFHVRDNGIGIDKEYHQSIFTMLKRLHSKNLYEGSGIGLSICEKIMHNHAGKIYVQSVPEGGSDFVLTFPKISSLDFCE